MEQIMPYVKAFEAYLRSVNKSPYTVKQYTLDAKQFAEIVAVQTTIEDALQMYEETITKQYHSVNSINRKYASTRHFLSFLQLRDVIKNYSPKYLQPLNKEQAVIKTLEQHQAKKALAVWFQKYEQAKTDEDAWLALRNATIVAVIAELGIKSAEVVRMEWKHFHEASQQWTVIAAKKSRKLPLSNALMKQLLYYQEETLKWMPIASEVSVVWLGLGNKKGQSITVKTVERIFFTISQQVSFKVTTTNLRYRAMQNELADFNKLTELYEQFGYARKGVFTERQQRMTKQVKE
ncbi:recombinase XerD [Solibacillus sp. R5-41]|uniref:tyrosine-type recombinase/integrase n=1 Tax=Solibacillus sp. R5-41 TaxID=2048654 RepID=UPI000C127437|nr:site-specific integrase [Solibacillus sp. R5-41]ATP40248.1 recombinase XerD [Solibacillus sp. R5-41]